MREPEGPVGLRMKYRYWTIVLSVAACALAFWLDEPTYRWVHENFNENTRPIPTPLKFPHRWLRTTENWGENVVIGLVAATIWLLDAQGRRRAIVLVLAVTAVSLLGEGIKVLTARGRPDVTAGRTAFSTPDIAMRGGDYRSFPSGHTIAGAGLSGALSVYYPPLRPVVILLAVSCGASRIWKERHFLSDCVAGLVVGYFLAAGLTRKYAPFKGGESQRKVA